VVFVADSQPAMVDANRESFANLLDNLEENQIDPNDTPIVIQFNKRDLPGVLPVEKLQEALNFEGYPYTEASALKGEGVMETFKLISKLTAKHLFARVKGGKSDAPAKKSGPVAAAKVAAQPAPPVESEPEPMLDNEPLATAPNPFAGSVPIDAPFDGAAAVESDYEAAEEVSLEQLLAEGRSRPTFSGSTPVPLDEIEELGAEELVESPGSVAVMEQEPMPTASNASPELEARIASLEQQLQSKQAALRTVLRELDELRRRVSDALADE
jgi:hypothetical protein